MISQKVNTREIDFVNFREAKFSFLNITALVKRVVENSFLCAFSCLKNLACFSFNVAAFPDKAGKFTCEILTSDKYNNSENFLPSKTLHHFSIEVRINCLKDKRRFLVASYVWRAFPVNIQTILRTVPTIVIAHTFCASPDTRISYRQ